MAETQNLQNTWETISARLAGVTSRLHLSDDSIITAKPNTAVRKAHMWALNKLYLKFNENENDTEIAESTLDLMTNYVNYFTLICTGFDSDSKNQNAYSLAADEEAPNSPAISLKSTGINLPNIEYSINGGTWTTWTGEPNPNSGKNAIYNSISLNIGDYISFRGVNKNGFNTDTSNYSTFVMSGKFSGCGNLMSLIYGDKLSENKVPGNYCFYKLFANCKTLTETPMIMNNNQTDTAYDNMYEKCESLTSIVIPDYVNNISEKQYFNCSNLEFVKYNQKIFNNLTSLQSEFNKNTVSYKTNSFTGASIANAQDILDYLRFTCTSQYGTITLKNNNGNTPNVYYSINDKRWVSWNYTTIQLNENDTIKFKGLNENGFGIDSTHYSTFSLTGNFTVKGDVTALLDNTDATAAEKVPTLKGNYCFAHLFDGCKTLTFDSNFKLSATTLETGCYVSMFANCDLLTKMPIMSATTLADSCYSSMFANCTGLTSITKSALSKTALKKSCYENMFSGCTNITSVDAHLLPATILAHRCYAGMFEGCVGLGNTPELPAQALKYQCYMSMFKNCANLTLVNVMNFNSFDISDAPDKEYNICREMFEGCTSLEKLQQTMLYPTTLVKNCYAYMFNGCIKLTTTPILPAETLVDSCYYGMFKNCSNLNTVICLARILGTNSCDKWLANAGCVSSQTLKFIPSPFASCWYKISCDPEQAAEPWNVYCLLNDNQLFYKTTNEKAIKEKIKNIGTIYKSETYGNYTLVTLNNIIGDNKNAITIIPESLFANINYLYSIAFPSTIINVEKNAFNKCTKLNELYFSDSSGNSMTINDDAFANISNCCVYVKSYRCWLNMRFDNKAASPFASNSGKLYQYNGEINKITIHDNLQQYAFYGCNSIKNIVINSSVQLLDKYSCAKCNSLTTIKCLCNEIPVVDETFAENSTNCIIIVPINPIDKVDAYKAAPGWIKYKDQITGVDNNEIAVCTDGTSEVISAIDNKMTELFGQNIITTTETWRIYTFENDITVIPSNAFEHITGIRKIMMSGSITMINESAFADTQLNKIYWPNNLRIIAASAFKACTSLNEIIIPNNVTNINECAFDSCTNISTLTIGKSVLTINNAFNGCTGIKTVTWNNKTILPIFGENIETCVISNNVERINATACKGMSNLKSIIIPTSITFIDEEAFMNCTSLTMIKFENTTCCNVKLSALANTNDCPIVVPIESVNNYKVALPYYADRITGVANNQIVYKGTIPEENLNNLGTVIGEPETQGNWTVVTYQNNITSIPNNAFNYCGTLTHFIMPNSVTNIEYGAFKYCTNLNSININNIVAISDCAFESCSGLTSIVFSDKTTNIGNAAFNDCPGLKYIVIGKNINYIGDYAFSEAYDIEKIIVNCPSSAVLNDGAFDTTNSCPIIVPCDKIDEFKSADGWKEYADRITGVANNQIAYKGTVEDEKLNNLGTNWIKDTTSQPDWTIVTYYVDESDDSNDEPYIITEIGNYAFNICKALTNFIMPNSVTNIGEGAFYACESLNSIIIPNNVISIGENAFEWCKFMDSVTIGNSVANIKQAAFYRCIYLKSITIPNNVTNIGNYAFYKCNSFTQIIVQCPSNNTLGSSAFDNTNNCPIIVPCDKIDEFKSASGWKNYADRITGVANNQIAYKGTIPNMYLNRLDTENLGWEKTTQSDWNIVTYKKTITSIPDNAFRNCETVTNFIMPNSVERINALAFNWCTSLTQCAIPNSISFIGQQAFYNCSSLNFVTVPNSVTNISTFAFNWCTNLNKIIINCASTATLGAFAFDNTNNCPIIVPKNKIDEFKSANGWKEYADRIVFDVANNQIAYKANGDITSYLNKLGTIQKNRNGI